MRVVILFILFIIVNLSASEWRIEDNVYFTNAISKSSNMFGFHVLNGKKCNLEMLYLTFNTINRDINKHQKEVVFIDFLVDGKTHFQIKTHFSSQLFPEYHFSIVYFTDFIFNTKTMKFFENSKKVTISINQNQKIAKYFDIKSETYNLEHMKETRKKIVKKECKLEI